MAASELTSSAGGGITESSIGNSSSQPSLQVQNNQNGYSSSGAMPWPVWLFYVVGILVIIFLILQLVDGFRYISMLHRPLETSQPLMDKSTVVSLTTTPDRLDAIVPTLNSLLDQSQTAPVVLVLPRKFGKTGQDYILPPALTNVPVLEPHKDLWPGLSILWVDKDWGPATKFQPLLPLMSPRASLIFLDDDHIYGRHLLRDLIAASRQYPHAAVCIRGGRTNPKKVSGYNSIVWWKETWVDMVFGYAGVLVKPKFFDLKLLQDYTHAPREAFFVDDMWISGHLAARRVPRLMLPFSFRTTNLPRANSMVGLCTTDNLNGHNNRVTIDWFKPAFDY